MTEEWKPITDWEELYEISNDGRIEVFNDQCTFANVLGVSQSLIHNWLHDKQGL